MGNADMPPPPASYM